MDIENVLLITVPVGLYLLYGAIKRTNTKLSYSVLVIPVIYILLFETKLFNFVSSTAKLWIFYSFVATYMIGVALFLIFNFKKNQKKMRMLIEAEFPDKK